MRTNTAKARLRAGETIYGCFVRYPEPGLVEVLGYQGWDYLVFDAEHGTVEPRDCEHMVRAAEIRGVSSLVRVPTNQPPVLLRYLDTGIGGVQVPWVNSAADAERAVQAVKYQPRGSRGLAGVRAADYAQVGTLAEYVPEANRETMIVLQIESLEGLANVREIAAVPDVDVIFIGPADLSHSFGRPGDVQHPDVQAAMQTIADAVQEAGVALGTLVTTVEAARAWRARGARYLLGTTEMLLRSASRAYLEGARQ